MTRFVRAAMAVAALGLAFSASEAQAQIGFSIGGGPSFAMGDFGEGLDMGYHAKVGASFSIPLLPIGLQADAMWNRFDVSDVDDAKVQTLSGSLNAVINIPTPVLTPYLIGGVGYYNNKFEGFGIDADENDFGVNVGGGVRLGLPGLGVFAEARLHNVFTEGESTRFVPVTIGIRL
jgi:hypothetical protein